MFGQMPMPASPQAENIRVKMAKTFGKATFSGQKRSNLCRSHRLEISQSRSPKTAGKTVEKGRVAYQKYSDELNSGSYNFV